MTLGPKPIQQQIAKDLGALEFDPAPGAGGQRKAWLSGMLTVTVALLGVTAVLHSENEDGPELLAQSDVARPAIEPAAEPEASEPAPVEKAPSLEIADAAVCASELTALARFSTIYFEADSVLLDSDGLAKARQVAEALQVCPNMRLQVWGHADGSGSDQANLEISRKRAANTLVALEKMGFDTTRIALKAAGASLPLAQGDTDDALDRRVEFRVLPAGQE